MRIAGVRLSSGRVVWLDAGQMVVTVLDGATAAVDGIDQEGEVFVAPDQMVAPPDRIDGRLVESHPLPLGTDDCDSLPGAELPALGQAARWRDTHGIVVALEPVEGRVTIRTGDSQSVIPLGDVSSE